MTPDQINSLLREGESSSLDFKREQYRFEGASDEEKSELLKDLLAFANSWRRSDAYILVGVEEIPGGQPATCGITEHIDDSRLQQFVNSKTQRPLTFSYRVAEFHGVQLGIFHIPLQDRPLYLKRDFGRLKANTVYLRRGSSTAIADPDEIARMGATTIQGVGRPTLEFGVVDATSHEWLGTTVKVATTFLQVDPTTPRPTSRSYLVGITDPNYPKLLLQYVQVKNAREPVAVALRNGSAYVADAVYVEIEIPRSSTLFLFDENTFPTQPSQYFAGNVKSLARGPEPDLIVQDLGTRWKISADIGKVRPGATVVTRSVLHIGASESQKVPTEAVIYSQNLPPLHVPLLFDFTVKRRAMQGSDWVSFEDR